MIVSKSRYLAGLQCHKLLWLKAHEPDAPELQADALLQTRFDTGHRVGELARAQFPAGVLIHLDPQNRAPAVTATQVALSSDAPVLFEASFETDGAFAAIDILERTHTGFAILEVKATLSAKPQHLPDLAFQVYLARRAGLQIDRVEVMHLNREHRHPDFEPLFVRTDVTADVEKLLPAVPAAITAQQATLAAPCPDVPVGAHCGKPYPCPFIARCWPERPAHDVVSSTGCVGRPSTCVSAATT